MSNNSHVADTNVGEMNYEAEVKKLQPLATEYTTEILGVKYYMVLPHNNATTPISNIVPNYFAAWRSAYEKLKK